MKLHIITIGAPRLAYARLGFDEYIKRIGRYHQIRVTHLSDKYAEDSTRILQSIHNSFPVALVIDDGTQLSSPELATFLEAKALQGVEVSLLIGGPNGLPATVIEKAQYRLSLSRLTLPHDLAMVVCAEAIYRASTISAGLPYHK